MGIGYLSNDKLKNIPRKHQIAHEFCFRLHDLMADLIVNMSQSEKSHIHCTLDNEEDIEIFKSGIHPLDFLATTGREEMECRIVINHTSLAIYSDMMHFIFGALSAFEKRKFSVAFNLLRKPFKEGLLLVSWMCGREEDFFQKLKSDPRSSFDPGKLSPDRRKEILKAAAERARCSHLVPVDHINSIIYDRKIPHGLASIFDKSTHYITNNKSIATENYNINMIFKNPIDNDIYDIFYREISYILFFLHMIQIEIYSRMENIRENYVNWLICTTMALFEIIFVPGRSAMLRMINREFGQFFLCPHCKSIFKLKKSMAARFFMLEMIECKECGIIHHFPFHWLLSKLELDFRTNN